MIRSPMPPRRTLDQVRDSIVSAAESCEEALKAEREFVSAADFLNAAVMVDVAEWDAIRAFAMAERFA